MRFRITQPVVLILGEGRDMGKGRWGRGIHLSTPTPTLFASQNKVGKQNTLSVYIIVWACWLERRWGGGGAERRKRVILLPWAGDGRG